MRSGGRRWPDCGHERQLRKDAPTLPQISIAVSCWYDTRPSVRLADADITHYHHTALLRKQEKADRDDRGSCVGELMWGGGGRDIDGQGARERVVGREGGVQQPIPDQLAGWRAPIPPSTFYRNLEEGGRDEEVGKQYIGGVAPMWEGESPGP